MAAPPPSERSAEQVATEDDRRLLPVFMLPPKREFIESAFEDSERFASQGRLRLAYSESSREILYDDTWNFAWWNLVLHCRMRAAELGKKCSGRLTRQDRTTTRS